MRSYTDDMIGLRRPTVSKATSSPVVVDARSTASANGNPAPVASPVPNSVLVSPPPIPSIAPASPQIVSPRPLAAPKIHVVDHPLARTALTALRNRHLPPRQVRGISNQLLVTLLLEATRTLSCREQCVDGFTGTHRGCALTKPVILLTLTRHGMGLAHHLNELFPELFVGTIGLERGGGAEAGVARLHLTNAPALADATTLIFDPVISTGGSAHAALALARRSGAIGPALIAMVSSRLGLDFLQARNPDLHAWTAGVDTEFDPKRGPLPGIGNFAARLYA